MTSFLGGVILGTLFPFEITTLIIKLAFDKLDLG